MAEHKYTTGQTVRFVASQRTPQMRPTAEPLRTARHGVTVHGTFQIVSLMPPHQGVNQYRERSSLDGHERMVSEYEVA